MVSWHAAIAQPATTLRIDSGAAGKPISDKLFGIFFEDLNYAADGGLYAELVQNRSFEYQPTEQRDWTALTGWELITRGRGRGGLAIEEAVPLHANNRRYVVLDVARAGDGVGLVNAGFDGIPVVAGEDYEFSMFAHQLYMIERWHANSDLTGRPMPMIVRLESADGDVLGEAALEVAGRDWAQHRLTIKANKTDPNARLVLLATKRGGVGLDMISLFPRKTFHDHANGLRPDLAQAIADLQPKFVRFPGGCLVHGNGLGNQYRWQDTIGPVETRRGQANLWGYHQSVGLGYFEFFQFCEDIGAMPLPVVPCGVTCQHTGHTSNVGQRAMPMEDLPKYIDEVLALIEWANGPATSKWGAKRAAAGHPEPFGLTHIGVGNEEAMTPAFEERFEAINAAIQAKHPEITVIGTVGPFSDGVDYDAGWKIANRLKLAMVDEHYYKSPDWFWDNRLRYDAYDRSRSQVYLGEFAAHDDQRRTTLRSALAEAAYMTTLERNGDVVRMASYAPLLAKAGHTQWNPDLIYFTNTQVAPTVNYYVQKLFGRNSGDVYVPSELTDVEAKDRFATSTVRDSKSGDLILKLVNGGEKPRSVHIELSGAAGLQSTGAVTVLTDKDPMATNTLEHPDTVTPQTSTIAVGPEFDFEASPFSLTVIRIKPASASPAANP